MLHVGEKHPKMIIIKKPGFETPSFPDGFESNRVENRRACGDSLWSTRKTTKLFKG